MSFISTLDALEAEVRQRGGDEVALVFSPMDRYHPGVRVETGGLVLSCDRYEDGPACLGTAANLRAITRTLAAFRQIERDGVSVSAQGADHLSPGGLLSS